MNDSDKAEMHKEGTMIHEELSGWQPLFHRGHQMAACTHKSSDFEPLHLWLAPALPVIKNLLLILGMLKQDCRLLKNRLLKKTDDLTGIGL